MTVRNSSTKLNIPMVLACILLCATLISIHMTSGLYSRYVADTDSKDSARVIRFGDLTLEESGDFEAGKTGIVIPGADMTKKATVSFAGSEAATYVFVTAVLSDNWKGVDTADDGVDAVDTFRILSADETIKYMEWQIADGWTYLSNAGGEYVYYKALEPNTTLNKADIVADNGMIMVSSKILAGTSFDDTYIKFQVKVVQAGGFADAAEAWNSIKGK